mmetsp:Transcript_33175/g.86735  ORF Transcript_33175/g.86735 Transcript_33175/m.86735 type:complete len:101 (-) Transcript_33175:3124-3426(-)
MPSPVGAKPQLGDFGMIASSAIAAYCAPNIAFSFIVIFMSLGAVYLAHVQFNIALTTISDLCADMAKNKEALDNVKKELKALSEAIGHEVAAGGEAKLAK